MTTLFMRILYCGKLPATDWKVRPTTQEMKGMQFTIDEVSAHEARDGHFRPTVSATCRLASGAEASAAVPSGTSTGENEALELRDQAILSLEHIPGDTAALAWLANYVVDRDR